MAGRLKTLGFRTSKSNWSNRRNRSLSVGSSRNFLLELLWTACSNSGGGERVYTSELNRETGQCRSPKEKLVKEADELKQLRVTFEQEWEALDEKEAEIVQESKKTEEREKWEKWRHSEEERLRCESASSHKKLEAETEALKLDKELFAAYMKQEKSLVAEGEQDERRKMIDDFEQQKRDLEAELQKQFEEKETSKHQNGRR